MVLPGKVGRFNSEITKKEPDSAAVSDEPGSGFPDYAEILPALPKLPGHVGLRTLINPTRALALTRLDGRQMRQRRARSSAAVERHSAGRLGLTDHKPEAQDAFAVISFAVRIA